MADEIIYDNRRHTVEIMHAAGGFCVPTSISRTIDGKLAGGVVYDNHHPGVSIEMHVAGFHPSWVSRDLIKAVFEYPFKELEVQRIFGRVPASNVRALEFDRKFGLEEIARVPGVFRDSDQVILCLERHNCRFLEASNGR